MNDVAAPLPKPRVTPTGLVCRLRKKAQGRAAAAPLAGEIELENASAEPLVIDFQSSPLQYLDLVVTDAAGAPMSAWQYGLAFSPGEGHSSLRLAPGEKYVGPVSLLANVPPEKRVPGTYLIRAVFEYGAIRAVSEVFRLEYRPDGVQESR